VKRAVATRLVEAGDATPPATESARLDAPIEDALKRRVTGGFIVAMLLTIFLGFSSWRGARWLRALDFGRAIRERPPCVATPNASSGFVDRNASAQLNV